MHIDAENRFSDAQTVTTGSGSGSAPGVRSTNIIDLGPGTERRIGRGEPMCVVVTVNTALQSSGNNDDMNVYLYSDADPAWGSATQRQLLGTIPAGSAAGAQFVFPIRPDILTEQYIGLYYLSSTTDAFTAAAVTAILASMKGLDLPVAYPDAITIS